MVRVSSLLALRVIAAQVAGRGLVQCKGLSSVPIYVINTDNKPDRLEYSRQMWGNGFVRVRGIDGMNATEMKQTFGVDLGPDVLYPKEVNEWKEFWRTETKMSVSAGEAACAGSHMLAIQQLHADGHPYALVMEDDMSPIHCRQWPKGGLADVVQAADKLDPQWHAIRLQWYDHGDVMYRNMRAHVARQAVKCDPLTLEINYPELVAKCDTTLWGSGATLWSRRGAEAIMRHYQMDGVNRRLTCHEKDCHSTIGPLRFVAGDHCLQSTPELFAVRLYEEGSTIRGLNEVHRLRHHLQHLNGTAYHTHWYAMLDEVCFKMGENLPLEEARLRSA